LQRQTLPERFRRTSEQVDRVCKSRQSLEVYQHLQSRGRTVPG
jgi:hypothetical protein